jgi:uncharacterized membrane protein
MASDIILNSPIFRDVILPFVLVFSIIFAILERANILGEDKKQVNALVGLVIGLLVIAFPISRKIIVELMPVLAVLVVILLCFMIIYGFAKQEKEIKIHRGIISIIIIISVVVISIALLQITGFWQPFIEFTRTTDGYRIISNLVFVAAIVTAMVAVWKMKGN